jgi:hypothetical protein
VTEKGESERRPALPPESDATILTCRACAVDVSVSRGADARCPRCEGALDRPKNADGDAPERTLLEVRTDPGLPPPPDAAAIDQARAAARGDLRVMADTATQLGAPPSLVRLGVVPGPPGVVREPAGPEPVRMLGQYELRRVLGKGGMGVVYEAWQPSLGRAVALKVMSSAEASEEEQERFTREARAAAKLQHPNIVPIYDVGAAEGRSYFTMDLVRGRTMQELARTGTLDPLEAARLVARVARAIHYAHERGIIHRDLKPSNVLVDEQGQPHVMDFGLAKDVTDQSGLTLTGVAMGSPPYMPPEQAKGEFKRVDAVSDVYGLGAILYECLTGGPPFVGKSVYDIIAKVLVEEPTPPRRKSPAVSVDLETICLKALEKEKWRRYTTAEEMALDLERVLAGRTIQAVRHGFTTRIGRGIERHRWQIVSILVPVAVAVSIIGYLVGGQPQRGGAREALQAADADGGPIARVALDPTRAVEHLAPLDGPTWRKLQTSLGYLPDDLPAAVAVKREVEARVGGDPHGRVPAALLTPLVDALVRDPELDAGDLAAAIGAWFDGPLGEIAVSAVYAHRGAVLRDPAAYRLALGGTPTPIDVGLVRDAARSLSPLFAHLERGDRARAAVAAVTSDEVLTRVALRDDVVRLDATGSAVVGPSAWIFPPVTWPGAPRVGGPDAPVRPVARGLLGRGVASAPTTAPLITGDGARVVVGWLRFLYVLDEETGGVVRRLRLPGAARGLQWDASGRVRVRVWDGASEREVLLAPPVGGEGVALRWALPDGRELPVRPLDLLPADEAPAADELRRVACAFFPELDDRIDVFEEHSPSTRSDGARDVVVARVLRLEGRPLLGLTLGFAPDRDVALCQLALGGAPGRADAARITSVTPGSPAALAFADWRTRRPVGLLVDDVITSVNVITVAESPTRSVFKLGLWRPHTGGRRPDEGYLYVAPAFAQPDWREVAGRARDLANRDADRNPWLLAFAAVGTWQEDRRSFVATQLAAEAALSPHLTPLERVELGCFLDRFGLAKDAERAFDRALEDLVRDHGYAPDLAGYGTRDAGRALAERVDDHRQRQQVEVAAKRARARDDFAPALAESDYARAAYARFGVPVAPAARPPAKGVAHLEAIDILRLNHAIRLQVVLISVMAALLIVLLLRYRRHTVRDLGRLHVRGPVARLAMWWERPWTRLTFTWPTYITVSDKLALIVLYLLYFMTLSVQDAGFDVLAALRRGHEPLLNGLPAAAGGVRGLARGLGDEEPDAARAYALLWGLLARGDAADPAAVRATLGLTSDDSASVMLSRCEAALAARGEGRDHLLLAELLLARGAPPAEVSAALDLAARDADPEVSAAAVVRAGDAGEAALKALEERSPRQRLARRFDTQAHPLAPPPTRRERDVLTVGRTRWWSATPGYLLRNMTQPVPGTVDASLVAFEEAWSLNLEFARMRNTYFFVVPASVLMLVIALLVRAPHWFEPVPVTPPLRVLAFVMPGLPQLMRGRSVRGVLLLTPFVYVAQTLYNARKGVDITWLQEFARFDASEIAALTGEAAPAIDLVRATHTIELVGVITALYILHWLDLALARRKPSAAIEQGAYASERKRPLIVPVDSELDLSSAPAPAAPPTAPAPADGPFDRTERGDVPPPPRAE